MVIRLVLPMGCNSPKEELSLLFLLGVGMVLVLCQLHSPLCAIIDKRTTFIEAKSSLPTHSLGANPFSICSPLLGIQSILHFQPTPWDPIHSPFSECGRSPGFCTRQSLSRVKPSVEGRDNLCFSLVDSPGAVFIKDIMFLFSYKLVWGLKKKAISSSLRYHRWRLCATQIVWETLPWTSVSLDGLEGWRGWRSFASL